ncbi:MAG: helix-turn-helix domain-containing protein, partial [Tistlia sp.]
LASRLTHLVAEGVLRRVPYRTAPPRFEYRLTRKGAMLFPSMIALMQWGDRWLSADREPPVQVWHRGCGPASDLRIVCRACRQPFDARQASYRLGPGANGCSASTPPAMRRSARADNFLRGRVDNVARALTVVGDRWAFLLIREAFFGVRRFDAMLGHLGVATNVLANRLQRLVEMGIFERQLYSSRPERHEYRMTRMGRDLYPSILMLMRYGEEHLSEGGGPPLLVAHAPCGQRLVPALVCGACEEEVGVGDTGYRTAAGTLA